MVTSTPISAEIPQQQREEKPLLLAILSTDLESVEVQALSG
ncbi:hypothetical protein AVEN_214343-1, partial [Araneus ventricosus]